MPDHILRPTEAARFLGISKSTLYAFAHSGLLPKPIKIGSRASGWKLSTLEEFLEQRQAISTAE